MIRCHGQIFGTRNSEGDSKYTGQLFSLRVYGSRCDGCAQFYESGRQVDMSRWSTTHGVSRYQGPPCFVHHNPCRNDSRCVANLADFECRCPANFTGKRCDIGESSWLSRVDGVLRSAV